MNLLWVGVLGLFLAAAQENGAQPDYPPAPTSPPQFRSDLPADGRNTPGDAEVPPTVDKATTIGGLTWDRWLLALAIVLAVVVLVMLVIGVRNGWFRWLGNHSQPTPLFGRDATGRDSPKSPGTMEQGQRASVNSLGNDFTAGNVEAKRIAKAVESVKSEISRLQNQLATIKAEVLQKIDDLERASRSREHGTDFERTEGLLKDVRADVKQLREQMHRLSSSAGDGSQFAQSLKSANECLTDARKLFEMCESTLAKLREEHGAVAELRQQADKDRSDAEELMAEAQRKEDEARRQMELKEEELTQREALVSERNHELVSREQQLAQSASDIALREQELERRQAALVEVRDTLERARHQMLPPAFSRGLSDRREEIESQIDEADSTARLLWIALGRYHALLLRNDDVELARSLQDVGRMAYRYWNERGLDAIAQFREAEAWADEFRKDLNGRLGLNLVQPGQPKEAAWMNYADAMGPVKKVLSWCVLNANNKPAEKALVS